MTNIKDVREELDAISNTLKETAIWGLEAEVILEAMLAIRDNPNLSIREACNIGLSEWDI